MGQWKVIIPHSDHKATNFSIEEKLNELDKQGYKYVFHTDGYECGQNTYLVAIYLYKKDEIKVKEESKKVIDVELEKC